MFHRFSLHLIEAASFVIPFYRGIKIIIDSSWAVKPSWSENILNKELTRFGDWKLCRHVMIPLLKVKMFFRLSRFVEWSSRCSRRTNSRRNWQLNTCKRLFEKLPQKKNEKWLWKCILPVFCCFHPNERLVSWAACTFPSELYSTIIPDRLRRSVWVSIVLFRRNVKLERCRWRLSTSNRSLATFKCTFGTRRP